MSALGLLAWATLVAAAGQGVDVVFLPDAPELPPLVVRISEDGTRRSVAWVIPAEPPSSGARINAGGSRRSLLALPQAPAGAALRDDGEVLVLTLDNAGDWPRHYRSVAPQGRARVAGVSVDGERALRLVVPPLGAPPGPATLVGASLRLAGKGVSVRSTPEPRALVRVGTELLWAPLSPVDALPGCGGALAASFSSDALALRLVGVGGATCAGSVAALRVSGARLGARQDSAVAGVVVLAAP